MYREIKKDEISQHIENLNSNGFSLVENYLDIKLAGEVNSRVEDVFEEYSKTNTTAPPKGYQNIIKNDPIMQNAFIYSEDILTLCSTGDHLEIYSHFLNDPYYGLIPEDKPNFNLAQCNLRKGATALPMHYDIRMQIASEKSWSMQGILALDSRGKNNGGLVVIPGSHKLDKPPTEYEDLEDEVFVDLGPGDLVIFNSSLFHATTDVEEGNEATWGLLLTYRSWWCKPQFNIFNMMDQKGWDSLSEVQKTLFGYYSQPSDDPNGSASARTGYKV